MRVGSTPMVRRLVGVLASIYTVCAALSLWLIAASIKGWMGVAPDALSALPAMALALPWSLLLGLLDAEAGALPPSLLLGAGMAANAALLWWLARRKTVSKEDVPT